MLFVISTCNASLLAAALPSDLALFLCIPSLVQRPRSGLGGDGAHSFLLVTLHACHVSWYDSCQARLCGLQHVFLTAVVYSLRELSIRYVSD